MTLTLEISPDLEERLSQRAAIAGVPLSKLATKMLEEATRVGDQAKPMTGAELVALWETEGVFGAWADRTDIGDSAAYARTLRHKAEHRDWLSTSPASLE
jgi:hypothetical protein